MAHIRFAPDTSLYDWIMGHAVHQPNGQTLFTCPWHGPATGRASSYPIHGDCEGCIILWFFRLEAVTPSDKREELFDNLQRYMTAAVQSAEKGDFDFEVARHPDVAITLDPTDFVN